jgi:BlaI family transcriptional regulator, penicillinase repressor
MMSPQPLPELSRAELAVLKPLWAHDALSARELHDALDNGWAYTTTRTMLERLVAKGHVGKEQVHGINVYSVRISRVHALAALVRDFARSVLEIEPSRVAPLFLEGEALTEEEVAELEAILRKREDAR